MPNYQTVQQPEMNPVVKAIFDALNVIPQGAQQSMLGSPQGLNMNNNPALDFMANRQGGVPQAPQAPQATQMATSIPASIPGSPQPQQSQPAQQDQGQSGEMNSFMKFLIQAGVPLGAAIAGTANPNLLPQAAGLATGYVVGQDKYQKREDELKKLVGNDEVILFDDKTGEYEVVKVPPNRRIITKGGSSSNKDFMRRRGGSVKTPEKSAVESTESVDSKILVEKNGKQYRLHKDKLDEAKKQGYSLVE